MPLPANLSTGTVTGSGFLPGTVFLFDPAPDRITDGTNIVELVPTNVAVGSSGSFSVVLIATDDVDYTPINWTYQVTASMPDGDHLNFAFSLPGGTTQNIATVAAVAPAAGTSVTPTPPINARTYGAIGDGVTNDRAAIQAAFNAAIASGHSLILPKGNYLINTALDDITAPIQIDGEGSGLSPGTAITQLTFAAGVKGLTFGTGSDGGSVSKLYLKSNSSIAGTDDGLILKAARVRVEDVIIQGFGRYGLVADTSVSGNCNLFHLEKVRSYLNKSHGFFLKGSNTNAGKSIGCSAVSNSGWGFRQESTATNLSLGPHAQGNTLGDYYDSGASNHWYDVYSEGSGTFEIATGSTYGVLTCGGYALPTIVADAAAITTWTVLSQGRWMRQMRVGPTPADANQNVFKWGVGSPNGGDFYFQNETVGPTRIFWVHRSTHALTIEQSLNLDATGGAGYIQFTNEQSADPAAPAANGARLFTKDNGAGKTQLCVRFNTGAVVVIATEP